MTELKENSPLFIAIANITGIDNQTLTGHNNGQFRNCQSWSYITVHGQNLSNELGL